MNFFVSTASKVNRHRKTLQKHYIAVYARSNKPYLYATFLEQPEIPCPVRESTVTDDPQHSPGFHAHDVSVVGCNVGGTQQRCHQTFYLQKDQLVKVYRSTTAVISTDTLFL